MEDNCAREGGEPNQDGEDEWDIVFLPHQEVCTSNQECHFHRLPDELIVRILQNLHPVDDALPRLAFVCHKWHKILANTSSLWRKLHIRQSGYTSWQNDIICDILITYGQHVQEFTWDSGMRVFESVFCLLPSLTSLTILNIPVLWEKSVIETLSPLSNLEEIQINGGFALTDDDLVLIALQFPDLRRVTLNSCWSITIDGIKIFLSTLHDLSECVLKINTCLPLDDSRSDNAMTQGSVIVRGLGQVSQVDVLTCLVLNFVSVDMDELWSTVAQLERIRKLTISNCESLQGVRLFSSSLHKLHLFSLWSAQFISVKTPSLRRIQIGHGMDSAEHIEILAAKLKTLMVDGSGILRTLVVKSNRLIKSEIRHCPNLDRKSFLSFLSGNPSMTTLILGNVSREETLLDASRCPNLQIIGIQSDFTSRALSITCPSLQYLHFAEDAEITDLTSIVIVADQLQSVSLTGVPMLRSIFVQTRTIHSFDVNMFNDSLLYLQSCVFKAAESIGEIRLHDCSIHAVIVMAPSIQTLVLYRCLVPNYALQMTMYGCKQITHLSLEKCLSITELHLPSSISINYLNLYGCQRLRHLHVDSPELISLNIGQCFKVSALVMGNNLDLKDNREKHEFSFVKPSEVLRWTYDYPPSMYTESTC